jgi:hypothetical protein
VRPATSCTSTSKSSAGLGREAGKRVLLAGAPPQKGRHGIAGGKSKAVFDAELELSRQAEAAYRRLATDWRAIEVVRA